MSWFPAFQISTLFSYFILKELSFVRVISILKIGLWTHEKQMILITWTLAKTQNTTKYTSINVLGNTFLKFTSLR